MIIDRNTLNYAFVTPRQCQPGTQVARIDWQKKKKGS